MSDKYYLGFDAGTQSVKVAVYDEDQHCLAMDTAKTRVNTGLTGELARRVGNA